MIGSGLEDGVGDGGGFAGGRWTSWTRRMWAPARMAAVLAARVAAPSGGWSTQAGGSVQLTWQEAFAGEAGEDGEAEGVELGEMSEEGEVFAAEFAEAEAGVEDDVFAGEAGGGGGGDAFGEAGEDEREDFCRGRGEGGCARSGGFRGQCMRMAPHWRCGAGGGHGGVPGVAADVVDDLGAGVDGEAGGGGVEGVDGEDGVSGGL